jgi:hypothetical protein
MSLTMIVYTVMLKRIILLYRCILTKCVFMRFDCMAVGNYICICVLF